MTRTATTSDRSATAPCLRRPAGPGRIPAIAAPAPTARGTLPTFLRAAARAPRGEYWFETGAPVDIAGFDPREHILSLQFDAGTRVPELTIQPDEERSVTALLADGRPMVILHGTRSGFSLANVAVTRAGA